MAVAAWIALHAAGMVSATVFMAGGVVAILAVIAFLVLSAFLIELTNRGCSDS